MQEVKPKIRVFFRESGTVEGDNFVFDLEGNGIYVQQLNDSGLIFIPYSSIRLVRIDDVRVLRSFNKAVARLAKYGSEQPIKSEKTGNLGDLFG